MLKIKDNIDLKELEKYGFKPRYDTYTGEITNFVNERIAIGLTGCTIEKTIFNIFKLGKKWCFKCNIYEFNDDVLDILYDLIQAGIVEKVVK